MSRASPTASAAPNGPFKDGGTYGLGDVTLGEASCLETPMRDPLEIVPNPTKPSPAAAPVSVDLPADDVAALAETIAGLRLRVAADGTLAVFSEAADGSGTVPWVGNVDGRNPSRLSFTSISTESGDRKVQGILLDEGDGRARLTLQWTESTLVPPWFGPAHVDPAKCEADADIRLERVGGPPPSAPPAPTGPVVVEKVTPPPQAGSALAGSVAGLSGLTWFSGEGGALGMKDASGNTVAVGTGVARGGAYVVALDGTAGSERFVLRGARTADAGFRCTLSAAGGEATVELAG